MTNVSNSKVIVNYLNEEEEKITFSVVEDMTYVLVGPSTTLGTGQGLEKEVIFELNKEGVEAQILGLFIIDSGQARIQTTQHHAARNTTSDLLFKSVLLGEARFDYRGLIKIEKQAQNSNAYQRNDNLLLSSGAKVETKPELEILADEVRCTHGATTGRLDENQVFYLMSRGLSRDQAQHIMIKGFIDDVLIRIPDKKIRSKISSQVLAKLKANV